MPNLGNGRVDAIEVVGPMTLGDAVMPCLALQWVPKPVRGEKQTVQRHKATVTLEPTGASSKLKITLTVSRRNFSGSDLADLTYVISAGAANDTGWDDTDYTASRTATAEDLKGVIDLINKLPGFKAWALHAPHSMSINSDNFIALAATNIKSGTGPEGKSEILYRDVDQFVDDNSDYVAYMRIGLPEVRDANAFEIKKIIGKITGNTNAVLRLYRDEYQEYGETAEVYIEATPSTSLTDHVDAHENEMSLYRGPCILEVRSDDLTAAEYRVHLKQASLGA